MSKPERRYDVDSSQIEDQPETKKSISEMLEERRLDELEKKLQEDRADQLDAIDEQLKRPVTARDLQRKLGGETTGVIDKFFSEKN
jgi:hypothetical protein